MKEKHKSSAFWLLVSSIWAITLIQSTAQDVDNCASSPCKNEGTCIDRVHSFSCLCPSNWQGSICSDDVDECSQGSAKCDSNATCTNTKGSYTCTCKEGYSGDGFSCEYINQCLSSPCRNGASCISSLNTFSCSCNVGYSGRVCEIDIDDCASGPCKNGAVCLDMVNAYICKCQKGWQGMNCSTDVDECTQGLSRCDSNALCHNTVGSYTCTCASGYKGDGFNCNEIRLFSYGPSAGDQKATKRAVDFVSPLINIPLSFPFDSAFYNNLYFTDNGVIVFLRNIHDPVYVLSYPYTTFQSNDPFTPPLIAAFWADADLSGGIGDIYYQVYDFQSANADTIFRTSLENSFNGYFSSSNFNVLWAIKITWDNVPPFMSAKYKLETYWKTQINNTNTYQVVLATDGIYSFALILFEDGGMKWKYNSLTGFHLPKMGYYSGIARASNVNDFPAFNDPQTEPSVSIQQRYSPDQYPGFNTGKKGQWAYRLDSNSQRTVNSRLQCLNWYYSETAATWPSSCPCTYNQALMDPSFIDGLSPLYYGFDVKTTSEQYWSVQNMFPSRDGAGSRCYYSWSGALIYGERERYLPTPWASFNFFQFYTNQRAYANYFWNTVLPPHRKQYKDGEIDPFNFCCKYSGSNYLCNLYREKRPLDHCENYVPPHLGFFYGDPHINTLDGASYTFNGLGEFILAIVKDENDTIVFRLQGRTALSMNGSSTATNFVGLAAITSSGDQVQWTLKNDNEIEVSYNGTNIPLSDNLTYVEHVAFGKTATGEANVLFDLGISILSSAELGILNFVLTLQPKFQNRTTGLLGVYNGNPNDDFLTADGYTLPYNESTKLKDSQIYIFGMTWKTTPENSIFLYNSTDGESWYTYNNNSFIPMFYDELISSSDPNIIKKANITCNGDQNCLFDILSTGNFDVGSATMTTNKLYTEWRVKLDTFPPNISGPQTVMSSLNVPVLINYTAADSIFSLETMSSDVIITESGTLSWLPSSSVPVFATLIANNTKATAELGLTFILCNCSNNATCDYENTILRGERNNSKFMTATCKCPSAWTGEFCTEDYDSCLENRCFNTSSCVDNKAPLVGYQCSDCPSGLSGDGSKCFDTDECYEGISDCDQICIKTLARYTCDCFTGYHISTNNTHRCEDIDECKNSTSCAENAICSNWPGNFSCHCASGYDGDPYIFCTDINECASPSANNCTSTAICINTNGSYDCECLPGYSGPNCQDIDECFAGTATCEQVCVTTLDGYVCSCNKGYKISESNTHRCDDINECMNSTSCAQNAVCTNLPGSYSCQCAPGYEGDPYTSCTNILNITSDGTTRRYSTMDATTSVSNTTIIGSDTSNIASNSTKGPDTSYISNYMITKLQPDNTGNNTGNSYLTETSVSNTIVTGSTPLAVTSPLNSDPDSFNRRSSATTKVQPNNTGNDYSTLTSNPITAVTRRSNSSFSISTKEPDTSSPTVPTSSTGQPETFYTNKTATMISLPPNVTVTVYPTSHTKFTELNTSSSTQNTSTVSLIHNTKALNLTETVYSSLNSTSSTSTITNSASVTSAKSSSLTVTPSPMNISVPINVTSSGALSSSTGGLQTNTRTSSCYLESCPVGYCINGGICNVNLSTCSLQCNCPTPFTGEKCASTLYIFVPQAYNEIIKRQVEISAWIKGENVSGLNTSSEKYSLLQQAVNNTASRYLQEIMAFYRNSKVLLSNVNGRAQIHITSDFSYSNNATIIKLLNGNLRQTIISVFNSKYSNRRKRDLSTVSFGLLTMDNITDVAKASMSQLEEYFNCNTTGFLGYVLNFSDNGFTCVSPCLLGYCHNNATCEQTPSGPICRCASFSIYTTYGDTCENLAINLTTFFEILFGSLVFVLLVITIIILIVFYYRKRKRSKERLLPIKYDKDHAWIPSRSQDVTG
ncbi:uncharacterized protein RB166_005749 [Leptodactylus fuscus]